MESELVIVICTFNNNCIDPPNFEPMFFGTLELCQRMIETGQEMGRTMLEALAAEAAVDDELMYNNIIEGMNVYAECYEHED